MPKRRGHGEGTVYQRKDGLWMAQMTVDDAGKSKRLTFYGKTRPEALKKLQEALADKVKGTLVSPKKITLGEWLDTWLEQYKRPAIRPTTYDNYKYLVETHIKPALDNVQLKDLRPDHLQRLYNEKLANGRVDGQGGLSNRVVRYLHIILHAALKQALKNGLVGRNVAEVASPPSVVKKEVRVLSMDEQRKFLEAAKEERLYPAFLLALSTGLRLGELLALRWQDVNPEEGTITVNQNLVRIKTWEGDKKTRLVFQPPKTKAGRRLIPLPQEVARELKRWKTRLAQERLLAGPAYQDSGLVFVNELGCGYDPRNFTDVFYRVVKRAGIGHFNFHALRHTFATRMLELGEHPKVVQELLGDSQISVVMDTYSHVMPQIKQQAMAKLNSILKEK